MKKIIITVLAAILSLSALFGCGAKEKTSPETKTETESVSEEKDTQIENKADETEKE